MSSERRTYLLKLLDVSDTDEEENRRVGEATPSPASIINPAPIINPNHGAFRAGSATSAALKAHHKAPLAAEGPEKRADGVAPPTSPPTSAKQIRDAHYEIFQRLHDIDFGARGAALVSTAEELRLPTTVRAPGLEFLAAAAELVTPPNASQQHGLGIHGEEVDREATISPPISSPMGQDLAEGLPSHCGFTSPEAEHVQVQETRPEKASKVHECRNPPEKAQDGRAEHILLQMKNERSRKRESRDWSAAQREGSVGQRPKVKRRRLMCRNESQDVDDSPDYCIQRNPKRSTRHPSPKYTDKATAHEAAEPETDESEEADDEYEPQRARRTSSVSVAAQAADNTDRTPMVTVKRRNGRNLVMRRDEYLARGLGQKMTLVEGPKGRKKS